MPTPSFFNDLQFYIADSEPQKDHLIKLITSNGGSVSILHTEKNAVYVGPLGSTFGTVVQIDPQFIYECDSKKELLSIDQYNKQSKDNPNKDSSSSKSAIQRRNPYTTKDKRLLREWVTRVENFRLRKGLTIFQALSDQHPQHTAESWQNHWSRYMEKNLSREEKKRFATGASAGAREPDNNPDANFDQELSSPSRERGERRSSTAELLEVAASLHALHNSGYKPPVLVKIRKLQETHSKLDSASQDKTSHSREESPLFMSGHQQKEIEKPSVVQSVSMDSEELLEKQDQRNIISIKLKRNMDISSTEGSAPRTHTDHEMDVTTASQEDVIDLTAAIAQHIETVPENSSSQTETHENQTGQESIITGPVHKAVAHQPLPSIPLPDVDDHDKDLNTHTPSHQDYQARQSIPSYSPYGHDVNWKSVNSDNEWNNEHEQPKRKVDIDLGRNVNSDDDGNSTNIFKRHKHHHQESASDQTPPRHRTEEFALPSARASSEIPSQSGHIINAFAAEEAKHIGIAMKQHTYKRVQDIKDPDHRRWLGDLRGLMMDSDKDAMQVLTTLRICSGDWDVARAFLMHLKHKNQPTRQSNSWSSSSRFEVLQRDREELTRLMWSQKDDSTLLKGIPNQTEELIMRKGRNNTNARRSFLQNL